MGEGEQLDKAFKAWRMTTNAPRFNYPGIRMETLWRGFAAYQAERIKTLEMERDYRPRMDEWEAAQERIEALERFRAAVVGWREYDQPEWFDRRTAETVADLGREHEGAE